MAPPLQISVIIPTRGASPVLAQTLACLAVQTLPPETYEVVIVSAGAVEEIWGIAPANRNYSLQVLSLPVRGAARKRNAGAELASGGLLIFIDDDMAASPGFLEAHLEAHGASNYASAQSGSVGRVVLGYFQEPEWAQANWLQQSLHDWWEDAFYRMGQPGKRFRYDDLFSGNFSLPAALFHSVGGFNPAYFCHEDFELGVRLITAGARFELCFAARCLHQDATDWKHLFSRKREEGKADVQLARQYQQLGCDLFLGRQLNNLNLSSKMLRGFARIWPSGADLVAWLLFPLLFLLEKLKLRGAWQQLLGGLLVHNYWQGIIGETRNWDEVRTLAAGHPPPPQGCIDLSGGIAAAGMDLDHRCLNGVRFFLHGILLGTIPATFGAETLRANHLEAWLRGPGGLRLARARALFAALGCNGDTIFNDQQPEWEDHKRVMPFDLLVPSQLAEVELQNGLAGFLAAAGSGDSQNVLVRCGGRPMGWLCLKEQEEPRDGQSLVTQLLQQIDVNLLMEARPPEREAEPAGLSVVVCTRSRPEELNACLRALSQQVFPAAEIVVVNWGSPEERARASDRIEVVAAEWNARCVHEARQGLGFARNRGLQEARFSLAAFVDDDARPAKDWIFAIARAFAERPVAAVTGMAAPSELLTREQCLYEGIYGGLRTGLFQRLFRRDLMSTEDLLWVSRCGAGSNMAFNREILLSLGGFDPAFDASGPSGGGGDIEIFHRLIAAGHSLLYEPAALVWHQHRRDRQELFRQMYDNGCSFGAYLLTRAASHTIPRRQIAGFALIDWLYGRLVWRFFHPREFPSVLVLAELLGALFSPLAFIQARRRGKLLGR